MTSFIKVDCAREDCTLTFVKNKHNQKYCSPECCRIATNANIMKKYYENRDRLRGAIRECASCGSRLSRYNSTEYCSACSSQSSAADARSVCEYINGSI